jgi:hypothetical protein
MADSTNRAFEGWLASKPPHIVALAREFPLGSIFREPTGRTFHLVGYTDAGNLIVSEVDPFKDYDGAMAAKQFLCADHARVCRN